MAENYRWNLANIFEGLGGVLGDEPALIHHGGNESITRTISWSELDRRSNALARHLLDQGAKTGDKLAIYSYNRPEWIETLFAAFKARLVPVNVNYRYREDELLYLLDNSDTQALVFERGFGENVAQLVPRLSKLSTLIEIDDGSAAAVAATAFEDLASGDGEALGNERSPDDMLFIYTGGTTGMPKGVMWRQEDVWRTLGGGGDLLTGGGRPNDVDEHMKRVSGTEGRQRLLPACPLMHGTGLLTTISALGNGGSVVTANSRKLDAHALWSAVEKHRVSALAIVGDVFARPMLEALEEKTYDLASLLLIISSGVMWSRETKKGLLSHHPDMILYDTLGSSEATGFGASIMGRNSETSTGSFKIGKNVQVLNEDGQPVKPGSGERGMLARSGPIPVGYYKDPEKSAETFREYAGVRYSIPGDFATVEEDGTIQLLGRGSVCINTGGEKVFPEEVEEVLKRHAGVEDAAVVGLDDPKWGQAIHALVTSVDGAEPTESDLREFVRERLAAYKVPKRVFLSETLGRSPSGKMDYKGVRAQLEALVRN